MQPNQQQYAAQMAGIKSQREEITGQIEQEFPDRSKYDKLVYTPGRGWKPQQKPERLRFLESELKRLNEQEKDVSQTYLHWERASAEREERKEKRELVVEKRKSSKENLAYLRQKAAGAGEGTREERAYLQARETHRKTFGSVADYEPIVFTGTRTAFTRGDDLRRTGTTEGVPYDVPQSTKVHPGFLGQLGLKPERPRTDLMMYRNQQAIKAEEQFRVAVSSWHREALITKQGLVSRREYIKGLESASPGFKLSPFVASAARAKKSFDVEKAFYDVQTAKKPVNYKFDSLDVVYSSKVASVELERKKLTDLDAFGRRVENLTDWEKRLNVRTIKSRENLGLGFLNPKVGDSELAQIGKGYGNVIYYASGLGTAEFSERLLLYSGKATATVEGMFRTPKETWAEAAPKIPYPKYEFGQWRLGWTKGGRAAEEAFKVYDIRTPTGLVTWTTALAAPLVPYAYEKYSKAGQARAAMRIIKKPESMDLKPYFGYQEKSFGMRSNIRFKVEGFKGASSYKVRGPVTQEYRVTIAQRGPVVGQSWKLTWGRKVVPGGTRTVVTKGGWQYTTTKVSSPKLPFDMPYYVRSKVSPSGRITTKVFRNDVLLKTFKGKSQPGVVFTEARTAISKKEYLEHYGGLDEYRIETIAGVKSVKGVTAINVKNKLFKFSDYYPTGKGTIRSSESLGVQSIRLRSDAVALKPWKVDYSTGKVSPSGLVVKYGATKYKFVTDLNFPKDIKVTETSMARYTSTPALSQTIQSAKLDATFRISYERNQPLAVQGVGKGIKSFLDMRIWQSKKGSGALKLPGVETVSVKAPKPVIRQSFNTYTVFTPHVAVSSSLSFVPFAPVIQPAVLNRDLVKNRIVEEPIYDIRPIALTTPITRDIIKLRDIPVFKSQPILESIPQTITQQKVTPVTKQQLMQIPKSATPQVPGFGNIKMPDNKIPDVPVIPPSLFLPAIEPQKKKEKKRFELDSPFNPKYFASVEATLFNVRGKMPTDIKTGLNIRPIVRL